MMDIALLLTTTRPNARWRLDGNDYSGLTWLDDSPKPTLAKLKAEWPQVEYDLACADIEAARRDRYQTETDGMFFEAQRGDGNLDAWNAATAQIRADLPYPEPPK